MDLNTRIKIKINSLIHGKGKTVYEQADHIGKSHSYLCRMASLNEDVPMSIETAVRLMNFKKNFELLQEIAYSCGYGVFRLPVPANLSRKDEIDITADYQQVISEAVKALTDFFKKPTFDNYKTVDGKLKSVIRESVSIKIYCDKKASNQTELFS